MDDAPLASLVADLVSSKDRWACLPLSHKIDYLDRIRDGVLTVAQEWVDAACKAKDLDPASALVGEEWMSGPYATLSWIADIRRTLAVLDVGGDPIDGFPIAQRADGQTVVRVYPHGAREALLLNGTTAEVWMQPGVQPADVRRDAAWAHRRHDENAHNPAGRVALVLGAGNISSIAPLDALYKLYADNDVVIVKMNPVNDYLGPIFERAFAALIDDGYLRFAYGAGDVGAYLCQHRDVDSIHITGSSRTHDAIVYGTGIGAATRKARDKRVLDKPIASELGGAGPTIVVPGPWTEADFRFQAEQLVTQKLHNSGHNCVASQVLVLPAGWDGNKRLLTAIQRVLARVESRPAYYPGSDERIANAIDQHRKVVVRAPACTMLLDVDPTETDSPAFRGEFFGPVWAVTYLPAEDPASFLLGAVDFANNVLDGTLGANLVIDPKTAKAIGASFDEAISALRYGTIAINGWTALGYLIGRAPWGAFPGHTYQDVQSGIGVVHNALLLHGTQKTVVRSPFRPFPRSLRHREPSLAPRPPWFVTNKTAATTGQRLTRYAAHGKLRHLPGVFVAALRG